jgi:prepilin peptidase CpaA
MLSEPVLVSAVGASGVAAAIVDLRTRRVPNWLTLGVAGLGVTLAITQIGTMSLGAALAGGLVGLAVMLPGHLIGRTGAGDVKLLAALGTLMGPKLTLIAFVYTALAGGVLAVIVALQRRRLQASVERMATLVRTGGSNVVDIETRSDNRFAYAPAIAIGALLATLIG